MREFLRVVGAFGITMLLFYGAIFIFGLHRAPPPDPVAHEAKSMRVALQGYRRERYTYPVLQDNPLGDVRKLLVSGGYLAGEELERDQDARYISIDGKSYGLLFHIPREPDKSLVTPCLIEVNAKATGWWGQPPRCPF